MEIFAWCFIGFSCLIITPIILYILWSIFISIFCKTFTNIGQRRISENRQWMLSNKGYPVLSVCRQKEVKIGNYWTYYKNFNGKNIIWFNSEYGINEFFGKDWRVTGTSNWIGSSRKP